jgi:hypothetical protein
MRQIADLLQWVLLITVLLLIVVFTPKLAAYLAPSHIDEPYQSRHVGAEADLEADSNTTSPFDLSYAPARAR